VIGFVPSAVDAVHRPQTFDGSRLARAMSNRLGILLPDGATLLLRRQYRAFYRSLALSQEGSVVEKAYLASRVDRSRLRSRSA
jgi:hypothetical protein